MKIRAMATVILMAGTGAFAEDAAIMLEILNNNDVISAMESAWELSSDGLTENEATFRLDGTPFQYTVVAAPFTNETMQQHVWITPGVTFALFHVHPSYAQAAPSRTDRAIADKYKLKIFTMHVSGLYEYDPVTRKTTQLRDGLAWMRLVQNQRSASVQPPAR